MSHHEKRTSTSGLVITGASALFLFLFLRLLAVSGYDWNVAFAIIHTIDLNEGFGILVGTLMGEPILTGVALAVLLPLILIRVIWPVVEGGRSSSLVLLAVVTAALASLLATYRSWWLLVTMLLATAVVALLERLRHNDQLHQAAVFVLHRVWLIASGMLLILAAIVSTPWVPLEQIDLLEGDVRGYVMETSPGFLKILTETEREFLIIPTTEVISRVEVHAH
ncbi:hypothetical protein IEU95_10320 [Hoyosella rhizosphaerae]|uniref:Uncharacterized protein n=1 Tax=Hoyosella rhizosphaerae TaxID=1755582 RepID=A0A916TYQ2_9ACTN|nr:hypothetical protein [Hoyosella rhizosphaerae]MBN4927228.1 hypothetical protein [Hoyosella rhizosphaerae]GGC52959.1 hypothetical protein GCM10011410_01600 [Hoyosella rhizosphaerae]